MSGPPRQDFIRSYKKQLVKKIWGRILGLAWLKFAVAAMHVEGKWKKIIHVSKKFENAISLKDT